MASTGTAVYPSTSLYPGASTYPGQGSYPLQLVLYSLANASANPVWQDATEYVRAFTSRRGRATELARVDAGTAQITLDNRTRLFDPEHTAGIRPMNRWRILEQFSGSTYPIFTGYAESYQQLWPERSGRTRSRWCRARTSSRCLRWTGCRRRIRRATRIRTSSCSTSRTGTGGCCIRTGRRPVVGEPVALRAAAVIGGGGRVTGLGAIVGQNGSRLCLHVPGRLVHRPPTCTARPVRAIWPTLPSSRSKDGSS